MKKTLVKSSLISLVGMGLMVGSAMALPWTEAEVGSKLASVVLDPGYEWNAADYWSLSDLTSGTSGDSTFEIRLENAGYESDFGLYLVDDFGNPNNVTDYFKIFDKADEVGTEALVYFKEIAGAWQVGLDPNSGNAGDIIWESFDSTFGFYYNVFTGGMNDQQNDYIWHTDKQFNQLANGSLVDNAIEHAVVAYKKNLLGPGGNVQIYLDDELGGGDRDFTDMTVSGNDLYPIPEPTTMLLFGTGLAGLAGVARRRRK